MPCARQFSPDEAVRPREELSVGRVEFGGSDKTSAGSTVPRSAMRLGASRRDTSVTHVRGANLRDRLHKWTFVVIVASGTSVLERLGATRASCTPVAPTSRTDCENGALLLLSLLLARSSWSAPARHERHGTMTCTPVAPTSRDRLCKRSLCCYRCCCKRSLAVVAAISTSVLRAPRRDTGVMEP